MYVRHPVEFSKLYFRKNSCCHKVSRLERVKLELEAGGGWSNLEVRCWWLGLRQPLLVRTDVGGLVAVSKDFHCF